MEDPLGLARLLAPLQRARFGPAITDRVPASPSVLP